MTMYAMKHDNRPTDHVHSRDDIIDGFKHDFTKDIEENGPALDGATWKFVQEYSAILRTSKSEMTFKDCKEMVKQSIMEYMERVNI